MKKAIMALVLLLQVPGCFGQAEVIVRLDHQVGLSVFYADTGDKPSNQLYNDWAHDYFINIYNKYQSDEFEWQTQLQPIRNDLDKRIASVDKNAVYDILAERELGSYDFDKGGFPLVIPNGTYYDFNSGAILGGLRKLDDVNVILNNSHDFNFVRVNPDDAKKFVSSRKDGDGNISRDVIVDIEFRVLSATSEEYATFFKKHVKPDGLNLLVNVSKISVLDQMNKNAKIGEID